MAEHARQKRAAASEFAQQAFQVLQLQHASKAAHSSTHVWMGIFAVPLFTELLPSFL